MNEYHDPYKDDEIQDVTAEVYAETIEAPETAEERAQRIAMLRRSASVPVQRKHRGLKKLLSLVVLLAVLVGGTAFAFWYGNDQAAKNAPLKKPATTKAATNTNTPATLKDFNSVNFGVSFKYPETWKVTDGAGQIIARSPRIQFTGPTGSTFTGQVMLTFSQKGQNSLTRLTSDNAAAVRDSEKVTYTQPSSEQRGETYISFVQYTASASDQLDAIYVTGDNGYLKDQLIPKGDIANNDPLIVATFLKCSDNSCNDTSPTSISPAMWTNVNFKNQITEILTSLSLS